MQRQAFFLHENVLQPMSQKLIPDEKGHLDLKAHRFEVPGLLSMRLAPTKTPRGSFNSGLMHMIFVNPEQGRTFLDLFKQKTKNFCCIKKYLPGVSEETMIISVRVPILSDNKSYIDIIHDLEEVFPKLSLTKFPQSEEMKVAMINVFSFLPTLTINKVRTTCKFFNCAALDAWPHFMTNSDWQRTWDGLTKQDIDCLKIFCIRQSADFSQVTKAFIQANMCALKWFQRQMYEIMSSNPYVIAECDDSSPPFYNYFNLRLDFKDMYAPKSPLLESMFLAIKADFKNAKHGSNVRSKYFITNRYGEIRSTEFGRGIIKKLCDYALRHIVLFNFWLYRGITHFDSDSYNTKTYQRDKHKDWDSFFPTIFSSLDDDCLVLVKQYLQPVVENSITHRICG